TKSCQSALSKRVHPDGIATVAAGDSPLRGQSPRYVGECAVGSVDTRGVVSEAGTDRVFVEVRWSGTVFEVRDGAPPERRGSWGIHATLFVLARASTARSRV